MLEMPDLKNIINELSSSEALVSSVDTAAPDVTADSLHCSRLLFLAFSAAKHQGNV